MAEILKNTGAKLWSMVDDHDELQSNVFDQLFGTGGKSDIRLIDEAIGKINESLDGYYFKMINDKLCICKDTDSGTTSLPLSITDDNGHIALKVDGTSITIDGNGVVHGATVDDVFSLTSENAIQNKVVKAKFDEIDGKVKTNETTISSHKNDQNNPHNVTKSQLNLGNVEDKSSETIRSEITKENVTTALGYTPYTPNEVDNKFSTLETNIDWKEAVDTFADIATTYPNPDDGWTVNVKDTDHTYRYNGSEWVAISANAIPKATDGVDGLLSKEDHAKYDDAVSKAHTHSNQSVLDGITSDKVTAWDTVNNKVDKVDGKGLSTEDYTTDEKNKLSGIDKDLLDKLGESTEGNLTFNGDEINVAQMTGATVDKDGTSGTVPAPKVSDKDKFLRGDGTWAEAKQDLSAYYNNANYDTENNKLQLMNGDTVLKEIEISGGGGTKIVTFADGTDEEISAMIQAHYENKINISDYWAVGDIRSVSLSAMSATGVGESHSAQTVQFAIADFDHDDLTTAINGHSKAAVTLTQVHSLNTKGYMNSSNTNSGGWTSCARRTWCNNVYYNALPTTIKNAVKSVNKLTSAGSQSSTINTTSDNIFLLSEIEIFGSTTYSVSGEGIQYSYYKTSSNRIKQVNGSNYYWWERSPHSGYSPAFCYVNNDGSAGDNRASTTHGLAPCLCI